ncbi:MAG: MTH1187 family thiamine-binding protein [Candidatus Omnitrophica bacterium]|nr:MTH1187 family thiamine-binding protein [Candidatus Omnitrophota bacterium]MCK5179206.1 MTH1187 family thiamine-binding protein [Candidatus Omnitrophota bacterium]
MPIMEIKIIPLGTQSASVSEYVADTIKVLEHKKIQHQLTPMGTIIEADSVEQLFDVANQMHKTALHHLDRVVTFIELDERKDKKSTMEDKLKSVEEKLTA